MQYRNAFLTLTFTLAAAIPGLAVDPAMVNLIMPDAKVVVGLDVDRLKSSPFGQYILGQMKTNKAGAEKMLEDAGFDPQRDLREVLVATASVEGKSPKAVAIIRGTFDESKIMALVATTSAGTVSTYEGVKLLSPAKSGSGTQETVAILPGMLVAGDRDNVIAAIGRLRAMKSPAPLSAALVARIQSASSNYDAWVLSTGSPSELFGAVNNPNMQGMMKGDVMQGIENVVAGVRFGANVQVSAEATARSDRDANALLDVARFLISMAQGNAGKSPAGAMLESLQMAADGRVVKFSLQATEQDLEKMFSQPAGKGGTRARVRPVAAQ